MPILPVRVEQPNLGGAWLLVYAIDLDQQPGTTDQQTPLGLCTLSCGMVCRILLNKYIHPWNFISWKRKQDDSNFAFELLFCYLLDWNGESLLKDHEQGRTHMANPEVQSFSKVHDNFVHLSIYLSQFQLKSLEATSCQWFCQPLIHHHLPFLLHHNTWIHKH